jgi:hypothetical protein
MVLIWETVKSEVMEQGFFAASPPLTRRARVPSGWFVRIGMGAFFYPDPEHLWDGSSLP